MHMIVNLSVLFIAIVIRISNSEPDWWKSGTLYQIYPRSFADSDGDGNGDLKGILKKIPYLHNLGIDIIWISPIYKSPWKDMGYDISDYKDVHPTLGSLDDACDMIKEFHNRGMRVLMDLVPNHTSDQHPWFNASRSRLSGYEHFYVWRNPKSWNGDKPEPPNNWLSAFDGSAWEWDHLRGQFYLHQFGKYQVDLNYSNPFVVEAIKDVMRFWLDLGVDGFRVDTPHFLCEHPSFPDEPEIINCTSTNPYDCLDHIYTKNQPMTFEVLHEFQALLENEYASEKYLILEAYAPWPLQKKYYGPLMSPFNFQLINDFWMETDAITLNNIIQDYLENIPDGCWPNWVLGNHDNTRVGSRLGGDMIDAANMLILLLPGTSINFQGEEIGMIDGHIRLEQMRDCCKRDPQRTPMQWNTGKNSGFTSGNGSWLPVNSNYWNVNVEKGDVDKVSHLKIFRELIRLRKFLGSSTILKTSALGRWIFLFKRENKGRSFYVLINLNNLDEEITLRNRFKEAPEVLYVYISASNSAYRRGTRLLSRQPIRLPPRSGIVLKADYRI